MADDYVRAVTSLTGSSDWQRFQDLVQFVARRRWHGIVEKVPDRNGLVDLYVRDAQDPSKLLATIECKAEWMGESASKLTRFARQVKRRLESDEEVLRFPDAVHYLAVSQPVAITIWEEAKAESGLSACQLWDANALAAMIEQDPIIATFCDGLPTSDDLIRRCSLDLIVWLGVSRSFPVNQVLSEPLDDADCPATPLLVCGPPNVGKTCWSVNYAWRWCQRHGDHAAAFIVDARHQHPDDIPALTRHLRYDAPVLVVIDDAHTGYGSLADWMNALNYAKQAREASTEVLWIARSAGQLVRYVGRDLVMKPFPVDRVIDLFLKRLGDYEPWQRVLAALVTDLDPGLAGQIACMPPPEDNPSSESAIEQFVDWLDSELARLTCGQLSEVEASLDNTPDAYRMYVMMLPFGSIGISADFAFLQEMDFSLTRPLERLGETGLAEVDRVKGTVTLTQHPFQIRRMIPFAEQSLPRSALANLLSIRFPSCGEIPRLADVTFGLYLSGKREPALCEELERLGLSAEWAGITGPLTQGLEFLLDRNEWTDNQAALRSARIWYRKVARLHYSGDEHGFRRTLDRLRLAWEAELDEAEKNPDCVSDSGNRLDRILYEIAYLAYLEESYSEAAELFGRSVAAGLRAIERAMLEQENTVVWRNGVYALANIWIAGMLQRSASMRDILRLPPNPQDKSRTRDLVHLAEEVAVLHRELALANALSDAESAQGYLRAIATIAPDWVPPEGGIPIARMPDLQGMVEALHRHERNAWHEAIRLSCWPKLFGHLRMRIPTCTKDSEWEHERLTEVFPVTEDGLPAIGDRQTRLLLSWAEDNASEHAGEQAVACVALIRAGGGYEQIGDTMLVAWHCTEDSSTRNALAWYLEHRVPDVGLNGLAKVALARPVAQG